MNKRVLVPLAEGFEEIEAVTIVDILRRAGLQVCVAGVGGVSVTGSHGIKIDCDRPIERCSEASLDALVLPGGLPGTVSLYEDPTVRSLLAELSAGEKTIGAICAAPTILNNLGLLEDKHATCHPNHEMEMDRCIFARDRVVVDGIFITSRGAGAAIEFAAVLVEHLLDANTARDILRKIVFER